MSSAIEDRNRIVHKNVTSKAMKGIGNNISLQEYPVNMATERALHKHIIPKVHDEGYNGAEIVLSDSSTNDVFTLNSERSKDEEILGIKFKRNLDSNSSFINQEKTKKKESLRTINMTMPKGWKDPVDIARKEAEDKARKEAEDKARKEAEDKARKEAEDKARKEAEDKARKEAEDKARKEAEDKARKEAEDKARKEAEDKARKEAEDKARKEAEDKARKEAEDKARKEAEDKARKEAEAIEHATIIKESIPPQQQDQTIIQKNLTRSEQNTNNLRNDVDSFAANMTSWQYSTVAWIDMYKEFAINAAKLSEYWFNIFWSPWTAQQRKDKVKIE